MCPSDGGTRGAERGSHSASRSKALEGVRILDLSRLIPGPFCTLILADMGAEVIKVEEPKVGDYERLTRPLLAEMGYRFRMLNQGKKSVAVDLKRSEGREIFFRLVRGADVVVEGFRPGVMERLGLGYEALSRENPGIIYCSISSYGHTGPKRDRVAHDLNILGDVGLLDLIGCEGSAPAIPGAQLADTVTALYASIGILGALMARAKDGKGRRLDLSMHDCTFSLMFDALRSVLGENRVPERGRERLTGGLANYNVYRTKDGRYLAVGSLETKFKDELLRLVGLEEFRQEGAGVTSSTLDREAEARLQGELGRVLREKTLAEWIELLGPANICVSPVRTVEDALGDSHLWARGMLTESEVPGDGKMTEIGSPLGGPKSPGPAPGLGQHTEAVLLGAGLSAEEVRDLRARGVLGG